MESSSNTSGGSNTLGLNPELNFEKREIMFSRLLYRPLLGLLFCLMFSSKLISLDPNPLVNSLKTSIIVPCHYLHFYLIPDLLTHYENQTVLPDEIIISLSESHRVKEGLIAAVEDKKYPFQLKIVKSQEVLYGGQNRNIACEHSSGDILICQDADDIPHPQRVELIKGLFEKYQIEHLMHCFILSDKLFQYCYPEKAASLSVYSSDPNQACYYPSIHNGNIALLRTVFMKVKWPVHERVGEDIEFNTSVYKDFKKTVILPIPLLLYRNDLSVY